jgi:hypothetical protein
MTIFTARVAIVLALLLFHFYTRRAAEEAIPLSQRGGGLYSHIYRVSLSLIAGRGFNQIAFPGTPEAAPLREFTMLGRAELSPTQLNAYFRQPYSAPVAADSLNATISLPPSERTLLDKHHTTRVLDLRVAALLWKWFGVRWSVYFFFYAIVSTVAAFCVFLIGREAGGYWAGVAAMLFYTACSLEHAATVESVRDISPLWFASFGFACTVCLAGAPTSRGAWLMSFVGAGAIAALGYGWRPDLLILPPFLIVFIMIRLLLQRYRPAKILSAAGSFALGSFACFGVIRLLTPSGGLSPQHGFHIAYYGHAARANLFGSEDSLNIFRCDVNTHIAANSYAGANGFPHGGEPYLSPSYGAACRAMFLDAIRYDSWNLVSQFPLFLVKAVRATGLADLPINTDYFAPSPRWRTVPRLIRCNILDPLYYVTPYLTAIGLVAVLFWLRPMFAAATIAAWLLYYAPILLTVLPEYKHAGLLVLPVCILSGLAVTSIVKQQWRQPRWKSGGTVLAVLLAMWLVACTIGYAYSLSRRANLIAAIREVSGRAFETSGLAGPQLFLVRRSSHDMPERVGYLLEIRAGDKPGLLYRRSFRQGLDTRYYESSHQLLPGRKQYFFMTSYLGTIENGRRLNSTVLLDGDARILSARKVDLSSWKGVEVSTVFYDGERSPGSPPVDAKSNRTVYGAVDLNLDEDLLTADERLRHSSKEAHQLVVSGPASPTMELLRSDQPSSMSVAPELFASSPGASKILEPDALRFTTPPSGGQVYLQSPSLISDREQRIYVRLKYRLRKGNLVLVAFPAGGGAPLAVCPQIRAIQIGDFWTESISFRLKAGQAFSFIIANGYVPLDEPSDAEIVEIKLYATE